MKNTNLSFFMLMILWLASCNKKEAGPGPSPDSIAGSWHKTGESDNGQNLWCLYYYDTCALDDSWRFSINGSYTIIDDGLRCSTEPPPPGSWQLDRGHMQLDGLRYDILRCDSELWLSGNRTVNGFTVRHELRYSRP